MTQKAYDAWKLLRGIICVYKPPDTTFKYVLTKLKNNMCRDLNNLETRPPRKCLVADRSGDKITINVRPSYADNVLCIGPRYQGDNVQVRVSKPLGDFTSGVLIVFINDGKLLTSAIRRLNFTRCYHVKGALGQATSNYHINGSVIARATYDKVQRNRLENVIASYQSAFHTRVFENYGVPLQSQEAYNFALKGLYRPIWKGPPIIYGIKVIDFEPPHFTLEIQCVNETETFIMNLIHNLGVSLKCFAACSHIRSIREGCFHVEHAIPKNQWTLNNIIDNIKLCWSVLEKNYPNKIKFSPSVTTQKTYDSIET